jgi:hypothetical protein
MCNLIMNPQQYLRNNKCAGTNGVDHPKPIVIDQLKCIKSDIYDGWLNQRRVVKCSGFSELAMIIVLFSGFQS